MTIIERLMTGTPRELVDGEMSAVWKLAAKGPVRLGELGLDGDGHAYSGHGGPEKALLHYAGEHYSMWTQRFPAAARAAGLAVGAAPAEPEDGAPDVPPDRRQGAVELQALPATPLFGENVLTFGMTEESVCLGDRYLIGGTVIVEVTQPRQPCWKLGYTAGTPEVPRLMQETAATGWYYRVLTPGAVAVGDPIRLEARPLPDWPLSRIILGFYGTPDDRRLLEQLAELPQLSTEWRTLVEKRLSTGKVEDWSGRLYR